MTDDKNFNVLFLFQSGSQVPLKLDMSVPAASALAPSSEPSPSDSDGSLDSMMLAHSWPGLSTVAWPRDSHVRSLRSSGWSA